MVKNVGLDDSETQDVKTDNQTKGEPWRHATAVRAQITRNEPAIKCLHLTPLSVRWFRSI